MRRALYTKRWTAGALRPSFNADLADESGSRDLSQDLLAVPHELRLELALLLSPSTLLVVDFSVQITSVMASLLLWHSLFVA